MSIISLNYRKKTSFQNDLKKSEKSNLELAKTISDLKDENIRLKDELETLQLQLDEARSARSVDDSSLEV